MKKKLYEEISNKEYREKEGISSSDLKKMVKSMASFHYYKEHPEDSDSEALLFGRAYHKLMLEPDDFDKEFEVIKDFNCSNKEGKEQYATYVESKVGRKLTDIERKYKDSITAVLLKESGKDFITETTMQTLNEMKKALFDTPFVKLLVQGEHEKSFFWKDEQTGVDCKCRPDSYGQMNNQYFAIDLKTTKNAETDAFMRDAIRLGYDIQASHYVEGLNKAYGKDFKFLFIAQEKTAPYLANVLEADEYFLQSGKELRQMLLEQYVDCCNTGNWYGYMGKDGEINSLGVPSWIKNSMMLENETEEFE